MAALLPQVFLASQEPLASLVLDEAVGSLAPIKDINHNLTGFKLLPQAFLEVSPLHPEDSLETHNSLPPALTPPVVVPLDSTLPLEDRRTFLALDGLLFHQFLKQITTNSVLAKKWLYCRSGKPCICSRI